MNKFTKLALSAVVAVSALGTTVYAEGDTASENSAADTTATENSAEETTATENSTEGTTATENSLSDVKLSDEAVTQTVKASDGTDVTFKAQTGVNAKIIWEVIAEDDGYDITPYVVFDDNTKEPCGELFKDSAQTWCVALTDNVKDSQYVRVIHEPTSKWMETVNGPAEAIATNNGTVTFVVPAGESYSKFLLQDYFPGTDVGPTDDVKPVDTKTNTGKTAVPNTAVK